ncbi:MAG TPA: hypothetical protein VK911_16660 [Vicinamibacterales bacterium]|nr:hypothetical protein [Vicinamibacterales bacterium]
MPNAGWLIEDRCPQCGGPIAMLETDHIVVCDYCRVRLYVVTEGVGKYCLPVKAAPVGEVVMVPYWRLRGHHYRLSGGAVRSRLVDVTRLAAAAPGLPPTLGVRAQAVPLRFASERDEARFLPAGAPPVLDGHRRHAGLPPAAGDRGAIDGVFVASSALVYAPVRVARSVFDGVLNRRIPGVDGDTWARLAGPADDRPGPVRFLATLCPECGWQLEGAADTLVLLCVNCGGGWEAGRDGLRRAAYRMLPAAGWTPQAYLPFWCLGARIGTASLDSWADLVRFGNLPLVVQPSWEGEPLRFWIPAFGLHPDRFLRLAQTLTLARPAFTATGAESAHERPAGPVRACHAVTLPEHRLAEAVRVLLVSLARTRPETARLVAEAAIDTDPAHLTYVPVLLNGREYLNPSLQLAVQKGVLDRTSW